MRKGEKTLLPEIKKKKSRVTWLIEKGTYSLSVQKWRGGSLRRTQSNATKRPRIDSKKKKKERREGTHVEILLTLQKGGRKKACPHRIAFKIKGGGGP